MKKLKPPEYPEMALFDESVKGVKDPDLGQLLLKNRPCIENANRAFNAETNTQTWCYLPKAKHANPDAIVVGSLTKSHLIDLYDKKVVNSNGAARDIYNAIKIAAKDECLYCGGLDYVDSLDHYLPKARFPSYALLPVNLIPSCNNCNKIMGSKFPEDPNLQPLHPYFDGQHFFDEKWITAHILEKFPIVVDFDVAAPTDWCVKDQQRAANHFKVCKLNERYRLRVSSELAPLISQRKNTLKDLDATMFNKHLSIVVDSLELPVNGWKRTLYSALAKSTWFCENDFTD